jgi:hypothetical protein
LRENRRNFGQRIALARQLYCLRNGPGSLQSVTEAVCAAIVHMPQSFLLGYPFFSCAFQGRRGVPAGMFSAMSVSSLPRGNDAVEGENL